jgi:predicted RNA binding protein YcfA (HicA-like mRNA interferase family)
MSSLPSVSGMDAIRAFAQHGFELDRVAGSHHILKKDGHAFLLSVPVHGNQSLKRGTLRGLIRGSGLTVEQFLEALS